MPRSFRWLAVSRTIPTPENSGFKTKLQTLVLNSSITEGSRPHLAMKSRDTRECEHVNGLRVSVKPSMHPVAGSEPKA